MQHPNIESNQVEIPKYPGSMLLGTQTQSAVGGGGGRTEDYASADPPEVVIAFYEKHLGGAKRDETLGMASWNFPTDSPKWAGGSHLNVRPASSLYSPRGKDAPPSHTSKNALPQDTQTIIQTSYFLFYPSKSEADDSTLSTRKTKGESEADDSTLSTRKTKGRRAWWKFWR